MGMPPDFIYRPAARRHLPDRAARRSGAVALLLHLLFLLPPMQETATPLRRGVDRGARRSRGTLFGLSVTFLANSVWNTEDQRARDGERRGPRHPRHGDLHRSLTGPPHDGLYKLIADYGEAVAGEWDTHGDGRLRHAGGSGAAQHLCAP